MRKAARRRGFAAVGLLLLSVVAVTGALRYAAGDDILVLACAAVVVLLAVPAGWGRRGLSRWLAVASVVAAAAAAGSGFLEVVRVAASVKWSALHLSFGLLGLLLMVRPYEATWPRRLQATAGNLLLLGSLLGLGSWVVPEVVLWPILVLVIGAALALCVTLLRPDTLDDPEPERPWAPSPLEMAKDDHLLSLAQAALAAVDGDATLKAAFDARLEQHLADLADPHAGKADSLRVEEIPFAVRLEIMADILVSRAARNETLALAESPHVGFPEFVARLAQETVAALKAKQDQCYKALRQLLSDHAPGLGAAVDRQGAAGAGGHDEAELRRSLQRELLLHPSLLARVAEVLGASVPFALALQAELNEIQSSREKRLGGRASEPTEERYAPRRALDLDLVGLAFSGGGIRSATFNLGILQALADLRLLPRIDYLSTVSGGGYIGSWFVSWARRLAGGVAAVQERLSPRNSPDPEAPGVRPIRFLREYSNYLTPRLGLLGADTWTSLGIWLRNTFLVQSVLVLVLSVVLLVPRLLGLVVVRSWPNTLAWAGGAAGLWLFLVVCLRTGTEMGRYARRSSGRDRGAKAVWAPESKAGYGLVQGTIVLPGFLAGLMLSVALWHWARRGWAPPAWLTVEIHPLAWVGVVGFVLLAAGLFVIEFRAGYAQSLFRRSEPGRNRVLGAAVLALATLGPALVGGAVLAGVGALYGGWYEQPTPAAGPWHVITLGVPLFILVLGLSIVLHNGLMGRCLEDDRREWWSRLGAWLMIWIFGWLTAFGIAVYGPLLVTRLALWVAAMGGVAWIVSAAWGASIADDEPSSGPEAGKGPAGRWKNLVAVVAPCVFVVGLLVVIAFGLHLLLLRLSLGSLEWQRVSWGSLSARHWEYLTQAGPLLVLGLLAGAAAVGAVLAWRVDVNEFSMHCFYRNRLVRCYLGASREGARVGRQAHPFTGLDLHDDLLLATLRTQVPCGVPEAPPPPGTDGYVGPLPIVNTVLNLVKGDDLAWQERKAQSFVFTPLFSGYEYTPPRGRRPLGRKSLTHDGLRPTRAYGDTPEGLYLGTAMAISGAAANPNMGYHSSPAAAFLMTMFNVRLGWWLGNPRDDRTWRRPSPTFGLLALLAELTGNTNNSSRFVNLSDGGHFENLGIYELVRRRCRFIIACDAEQDTDLKLNGLGSAIRKCRTDFGVEIVIRPDLILRREGKTSLAHAAVGDILYPGGERGFLLYLKSSLTGDEPVDVLEYSLRVEAFPHESTADQFFDESQFESYRQLGYHIAHCVLGPPAKAVDSDTPQAKYWGALFALMAGHEELERRGAALPRMAGSDGRTRTSRRT